MHIHSLSASHVSALLRPVTKIPIMGRESGKLAQREMAFPQNILQSGSFLKAGAGWHLSVKLKLWLSSINRWLDQVIFEIPSSNPLILSF